MKSYIELINRFWQVDSTGALNQYDTKLYFFLLNCFNENFWKMPIGHSDRYLAERLGMSVNTLRSSKMRLQEFKLIICKVPEKASKGLAGQTRFSLPTVSPYDTVKGKNNRPTVAPHDTDNSPTVSLHDTVGNTEPYHPMTQTVSPDDTVHNSTVSPGDTNNKTILSNTTIRQEDTTTIPKGIVGTEPKSEPKIKKEKKEKSSSAGAKKIAEKETTPHWQKLVDTWFNFFESKYEAKPSFKGSDSREFKAIVDNLQKRSIAKNIEWTEEQAVSALYHFLSFAIKDKWLKENFLLQNLNRQFDKIITNAKDSSKSGSVDSAFNAIDEMYSRSAD